MLNNGANIPYRLVAVMASWLWFPFQKGLDKVDHSHIP